MICDSYAAALVQSIVLRSIAVDRVPMSPLANQTIQPPNRGLPARDPLDESSAVYLFLPRFRAVYVPSENSPNFCIYAIDTADSVATILEKSTGKAKPKNEAETKSRRWKNEECNEIKRKRHCGSSDLRVWRVLRASAGRHAAPRVSVLFHDRRSSQIGQRLLDVRCRRYGILRQCCVSGRIATVGAIYAIASRACLVGVCGSRRFLIA